MLMDISDAISATKFGSWHIRTFAVVAFGFGVTSIWQLFVITFLGAAPDVTHCKLPDGATRNLSYYIPEEFDPIMQRMALSQCRIYSKPELGNLSAVRPCNGYTHTSRDFRSTLVMDFNLVCDKGTFIANSQTSFNAGTALGAALTAPISDRFGRKTLWFICVLLTHVFGAFMAAMFDYWTFCFCQFLTGFFIQGMALSGFVLLNEMFPTHLRSRVSSLLYLSYPVGMCTLAGWGYLIRYWRLLQLAISLPGFALLLYWWFCPESPLWLHASGRIPEAEDTLRKAVKENTRGKVAPFPDTSFLRPPDKEAEEKEGEENKFSWSYLGQYLKSHRCRTNLILVSILMLGNNLVYFSMTYISGFGVLNGDRYKNFLINGLLEIPGCLICIFGLPPLGKRLPCFCLHIFTCLTLGALTILASPIVIDAVKADPSIKSSVENATTAMALMCKIGLVGGFITIIIYAIELFPTKLRNFGAGFVAFTGIAGATIAPYMGLYVVVNYPMWITGTVFTALSLAGAVIVLLVPDGHRFPLPETIAEIEVWPVNFCRWLPAELDEERMLEARNRELGISLDRKPEAVSTSGHVNGVAASAHEQEGYSNPSFSAL